MPHSKAKKKLADYGLILYNFNNLNVWVVGVTKWNMNWATILLNKTKLISRTQKYQ